MVANSRQTGSFLAAKRKEAGLNIAERRHADSSLLQMNCLPSRQILSSFHTRGCNRRTSPEQFAVLLGTNAHTGPQCMCMFCEIAPTSRSGTKILAE